MSLEVQLTWKTTFKNKEEYYAFLRGIDELHESRYGFTQQCVLTALMNHQQYVGAVNTITVKQIN